MQDENLKPIPIPPKQRWREFRVAYLPALMFLLLLLVIGWMWTRYVQPATIIGEVETVRANVISIAAGTVQELKVDRLQSVTNGQELAVVTLLDPDQINAELGAIEADLRLMKARMDLDKTRNLDAYSRLREEFLVEQLNLELARIHLQQAEGEFDRVKKLLDGQIVARGAGVVRNDFGYDVALRDRDALRAEVAAREKTTAELQSTVEQMRTSGIVRLEPTDAAVEQAIAAQRERLQRLQKPVALRSPINGFVSVINHLPGEKVTPGQPILVVSAEKSDRIIAWVRQPVTARPQIGDIVEVRRMTLGQPPFEATVVRVGRQLELINPAAAVSVSADLQRAEFGLPLIVKVAASLDLIPGEAVQVRILRHAGSAATN
jgi:multidrug resistance efflux pump